MKQITIIQHHGFPSEKAHSVYIMNVAKACAMLGYKVTLLFPNINTGSEKLIRRYYGIPIKDKMIEFVKIKSIDLRKKWFVPRIIASKYWFIVSKWCFAIKCFYQLEKSSPPIVQTGDAELIFLLRFGKNSKKTRVIYDVHYDFNKLYEYAIEKLSLSRVDKFVVNCQFLKSKFVLLGIPAERIQILPNGYNPKLFNRYSKSEARKKFNLPEQSFILGYVGKFETLGIEKGIKELLHSVPKCNPKHNICVVAVGGPNHLVNKYNKIAKNIGLSEKQVIISGHIDPNEVGNLLCAFDVGVMLYPPIDYFVEKMSPMKAVEYVASKLPILATNLSSIIELLDDYPWYVDSLDSDRIASKINELIENNILKPPPKIFSWKERQKLILSKTN